MKMRFTNEQRRLIAQTCLVLCLALVCLAYVRLLNPGAFTDAYSPSNKPLPVYCVDTDEKKIAISFDAAWGEEKTDEILDILRERKIRTTFFLVGYWVDKYPERVREICDAGHEIGNHSDTHPHMSQLSKDQIVQELDGVADKIEKITGRRPDLFRPPYGDYNDRVVTVSRAQGYECIQWDCDSLDWKNLGVQPMIDQVLKNVKNGSIVLFHNNSEYIAQALPTILDSLIEDGYEIVPVSELILRENYWIDHTGCQHAGSVPGENNG